MGATKVTVDNIKFDSKLEAYFYGKAKQMGLKFELQKRFVIQPGFNYLGKKVQDIEIVVDFYHEKLGLIDTKGFQLEDSKLKFKMLKYHFHQKGEYPPIYIVSSQKECDALINKFLK